MIATLSGQVTRVFYAGPKFSAGELRQADGESASFAGNLYAKAGDHLKLSGAWKRHPKYGMQFQVSSVQFDQSMDAEGLANYLANHPQIKGIGPAKAQLIAGHFSNNFEAALESNPAEVAKVGKVPLAVIEKLREIWMKTRETNLVMTWLSSFGLTHHQVSMLVEKLGNNALSILKADPYILCREIRGFGFKRVDLIARKLGLPKENEARIRAGILHCVSEALNQGHCWVELHELIEQANALLIMDVLDSRDRIDASLDQLIARGELVCKDLDFQPAVARPAIYEHEARLCDCFRQAARPNPHFNRSDDLRKLAYVSTPSLNEGQIQAVETVLSNTISLVSGPGGCGKSYMVSALNDICSAMELQVALLAPTGKAAKRLEEVVGESAYTIHRALKYDGRIFQRGEDEPLEADLVIVDESSMVDVALADALFRRIRFDRTALVLIGDHNQLPPVGPGNILRDLIQSRAIPMVVLDKVVRQAGILKQNSTDILHGKVNPSAEGSSASGYPWFRMDRFTEGGDALRYIEQLFEGILGEKLGFDISREVQLITPTHKGPLGTKELNLRLQKLIQKKLWGVDAPPPGPRGGIRFLKRDKVIQTRNNYETGVMNGTIGYILDVAKDGTLFVDFEGACVEIKRGTPNMNDIQLAYALTVHRVQGSEFPCVISIIHKAHSFMHHRNLLYTAVTRARKTSIIVGDSWGLRNCAQKLIVDERRTFLSGLLPELVAEGRRIKA